jgi:hypothetical protein
MKIITSKIPGEQARQYAVWLLYTEAGSLEKTLKFWERISLQDDTEMIPFFGVFLGKPVGLATIKRWSTKYHWKERTELKTTEDLEGMRFQFKRIKQTRAYRIAILFDLVLKRYTRQLEQGMYVTVRDLYTVWKMYRVEEGLSIGNYQVTTYQEPPVRPKTPEEIELDNKILKVAEDFYKSKNKEEQPTIT